MLAISSLSFYDDEVIEHASITFVDERLGGTAGPPRRLMLPLIVSVALHAVVLALALLIPLANPAPDLPEIVADFVIVVPLREAAMIQDLPPPMSPAAIDVLSPAHAGETLAPAPTVADARTTQSHLKSQRRRPTLHRRRPHPPCSPNPPPHHSIKDRRTSRKSQLWRCRRRARFANHRRPRPWWRTRACSKHPVPSSQRGGARRSTGGGRTRVAARTPHRTTRSRTGERRASRSSGDADGGRGSRTIAAWAD